MLRKSYQEGSIERVPRAKGPDQWVYRWWALGGAGKRRHHSKLIGSVLDLPTLADAKREVQTLRAQINAGAQKTVRITVQEAWEHFQANELRDPDVDRSPTTIQNYIDYFRLYITPKWGSEALDDVKSVAVEKWLRSLDLAPESKAKIRNHMSALFSHCIRHELYKKLNPIASVRQSGKRLGIPDLLSLDEIRKLLQNIDLLVIRVMVAVAAASALRRSEIRGLKWEDLALGTCWFRLKRGVVRLHETKMKTEASRRPVEMHPALAEVLRAWRDETPYPRDTDWVFASPYTKGERPYWLESAMKDYIRPAAVRAGIKKRIGWHTFRRSLGQILSDNSENVKTIQELLRHASPRITQEIYLQGNSSAKRAALTHVSSIFSGASESEGQGSS